MNEWKGDLPLGWAIETLESVCSRISDGTHFTPKFVKDGVPFVTVRHIHEGGIDFESTDRIAEETYEELCGLYQPRDGDVLFSKDGTVGKVYLVEQPPRYIVLSSLAILRPESEVLDSRFLSHVLRSPDVLDQAASRKSGTAIRRIILRNLNKVTIPIPPLVEQRRIVAKIEALQERSRRAREALSEVGPLLEQFRQSVLAAAFRGDLTADWRAAHPHVEPASALLQRIRVERRYRWEQAELAKYAAKGQKPPKNWQEKYQEPEPIDDSDLLEVPKGWEWSNLNEVSLIDGGLTKHEAKRSKATDFVPLISVAAIQHGYIDSTQVSEIGLLPTDGGKGKLENDDLLIVEGNGSLEHIGRAALWDGSIDNARHQNHLIRVRPVLLDPRFLLHWLASPSGRANLVSEATSAAGLYNLSLGKVGRIYLPIPPLDEQTEIVKQLDGARLFLRSIVDLQRATVADLNQLDQSILAKAFRGELVPQDLNDEPASVLLERIQAQRAQQTATTKRQKKTSTLQQRNKTGETSSRPAPQQMTLAGVLIDKGQAMTQNS